MRRWVLLRGVPYLCARMCVGVSKVLHLHFLPLGFQQPFLTDIVTAKVTAKTRLEMQKKQIPTERWRPKKIKSPISAVCPDEVDEGEFTELSA